MEKRTFLFLFGCIGSRALLTYAAYKYNKFLPYMGAFALLLSIGFLSIYFMGWRKTGPEVMGGRIWWNEMRPVHGLLYLLFAIYAFQKKPFAWKVLAIDTSLGLLAFLQYHGKK